MGPFAQMAVQLGVFTFLPAYPGKQGLWWVLDNAIIGRGASSGLSSGFCMSQSPLKPKSGAAPPVWRVPTPQDTHVVNSCPPCCALLSRWHISTDCPPCVIAMVYEDKVGSRPRSWLTPMCRPTGSFCPLHRGVTDPDSALHFYGGERSTATSETIYSHVVKTLFCPGQ